MQLILLKCALLLGVSVSAGAELVALHAPPADDSTVAWSAHVRRAASTLTSQTANGVLDFKPNKTGDYTRGAGQGKCNLLHEALLDASFALAATEPPPAESEALPFDALVLAEGEWSASCARLGVTKSVDRFAQAIGLVVNLMRRPDADSGSEMLSFLVLRGSAAGEALSSAGVKFEYAEYLRGETHYIVITVKKATLLDFGVLRRDLPSLELLTERNVDMAELLRLARTVASAVGLPRDTPFCEWHPAKLFDFSTRARCLTPFRLLGVRSGGAEAGAVCAADIEAHAFLGEAESK